MSEINMLEKLFTQGKISRREFLARTTALGVASTLPAAFLSKPVRAATPKKGDAFVSGYRTPRSTMT